MDTKAHLVRVKATLHFVGVLPSGGLTCSPEEAVKHKFKMMDASITGFVLEKKELQINQTPIDLPEQE